MNAHGKPQHDRAKSGRQAREMIGRLEAADRRVTPRHVAERFSELLDDIGVAGPAVTAGEAGDGSAPPAGQVVSLPELGALEDTGLRRSG